YFDVVTNFLVNIAYTADTPSRVTEATIYKTDIAKPELQVINIVNGISDISSNATVVKGWHTESAAITGYLGNELEAYRTFKVELAKLTAEQQAAVKAKVGDSLITAWDQFDTDMATLQANDALANLTIKTIKVKGDMKTFTGEEAMAELMAALYATARGDKYIDADDSGKATVLNSGNNWMQSFYVCFLVEKFNEAEVTLPKAVDDLLIQVAYKAANGTLSDFVNDFKYIYNVASLAEKITNGTASKNGVVAVVNGYMKGFTKFAHGDLQWNFNASKGEDFLYRSKMYVNYFGFGAKKDGDKEIPAKTMAEIVKIVTDVLDGVSYTTYAGATEGIPFKFGVTADITIANVKGDMPEGEVIVTPPVITLPESESVLPATADGWNADELGNKVTVSVANGVHTVNGKNNDQGLKYG
ncbi:MAG: hypothetical protein K2N84_05070, partial [Clostridia bacterium]|nr:hypothetical protein [Clostridia bacterium]